MMQRYTHNRLARTACDIFNRDQNRHGMNDRTHVRTLAHGTRRLRGSNSTHHRGSNFSGTSTSHHANTNPHSPHVPSSGQRSAHVPTTPRWS
jgi:hypothetical protein